MPRQILINASFCILMICGCGPSQTERYMAAREELKEATAERDQIEDTFNEATKYYNLPDKVEKMNQLKVLLILNDERIKKIETIIEKNRPSK